MKITIPGSLFIPLIALFLNLSCKKKPLGDLPTPSLELLLNGQKWSPEGNVGNPNLRINYDKNTGGNFNLSAYRKNSNGTDQYLSIYGAPILSTQKIILPDPKIQVSYSDLHGCSYEYSDPFVKLLSGYFTVTRLELQNHIFTAEFQFTLVKNQCDTLHIQGSCDLSY